MISLSHTCKGLESVHFKRLFADFGQIHFQLWANVILLQVFADLKYFICDALWSRSWRQSKGLVRNDVLIDTLWQIQMTRWPENRTVFLKCALFAHVKTEAYQDCTIQSLLTSTGDVVFNAKVTIGASGVVAGCEDNATYCLYLADHTGDCRGGHDAILTNDQVANLQERTQ